MSRRSRDYSRRYPDDGDESLWIKPVGGLIATLILTGVGAGAERIGDAWAHRNDVREYESDEARERARNHFLAVIEKGEILVLGAGKPGIADIPSVHNSLDSEFRELVNASMPGGQSSDSAAYLPHRYDLEWNGYAGKRNRNAPDKHCVKIELPDDAIGAYAWQVNNGRATAELQQTPEGFVLEVCQYGKNNTPEHHDVAVMAIEPGSR